MQVIITHRIPKMCVCVRVVNTEDLRKIFVAYS